MSALVSPPNQSVITDYDGAVLTSDSPLLARCQAALRRRRERTATLPPLRIDPLAPLPLADAALPSPAVRFVYFIMASRPYAHETINRNVRALQNPRAFTDKGTNESNVFVLHVDAKMTAEGVSTLRNGVRAGADVYYVRRPRHVMWAGFSMVLAHLDVMASLVARKLSFEYLINLSDADLTLRTDGELRYFFGRFPGRSIMSIVQRQRDPRRYKLHEGFRKFCWTECEDGVAWVVASPKGDALDAQKVIGKRKCCWSRSAPILYMRDPMQCNNDMGPDLEVYHGSQWASLHQVTK